MEAFATRARAEWYWENTRRKTRLRREEYRRGPVPTQRFTPRAPEQPRFAGLDFWAYALGGRVDAGEDLIE